MHTRKLVFFCIHIYLSIISISYTLTSKAVCAHISVSPTRSLYFFFQCKRSPLPTRAENSVGFANHRYRKSIAKSCTRSYRGVRFSALSRERGGRKLFAGRRRVETSPHRWFPPFEVILEVAVVSVVAEDDRGRAPTTSPPPAAYAISDGTRPPPPSAFSVLSECPVSVKPVCYNRAVAEAGFVVSRHLLIKSHIVRSYRSILDENSANFLLFWHLHLWIDWKEWPYLWTYKVNT